MQRIVLIAGFESFNVDLYRQAAIAASDRYSELEIGDEVCPSLGNPLLLL